MTSFKRSCTRLHIRGETGKYDTGYPNAYIFSTLLLVLLCTSMEIFMEHGVV